MVADLVVGAQQQDRVRGVGGRHHHVGIGRFQPLRLRRQRRRVGAVLDVGRHRDAGGRGQLLLHVGAVGAEDAVLVEQRDGFHRVAGLLADRLVEVEHRRGEHLVVRAGAEEPLQAALVQRRRRVVHRQVRHLVALGDLADGGARGAGVAADQGDDVLLRDQPLRLGAGLLRVVLVVGEDHLDVAPCMCGSPPPLPSSIGIGCVLGVDDVAHGGDGGLRVRADLRGVAGERVDGADQDVLRMGGASPAAEQGHRDPETLHRPYPRHSAGRKARHVPACTAASRAARSAGVLTLANGSPAKATGRIARVSANARTLRAAGLPQPGAQGRAGRHRPQRHQVVAPPAALRHGGRRGERGGEAAAGSAACRRARVSSAAAPRDAAHSSPASTPPSGPCPGIGSGSTGRAARSAPGRRWR